MMNPFELAYSRLNIAQKQAVDTLYWPVAVIAWPGTGKTQLLTLRIANILTKTDVSPRNILALTYTEAGSYAMRDRLKNFIGSDALRVNISTFHWFCKSLIDDEYPELFARSRGMKMLEELDARRLVGKLLIEWSWEHLKPRHDPELYMLDVIKIVGQLKREWVSPESFRVKLDKAVTDLPNNEDLHYKKDTKWWKKGDRKSEYAEAEKRLFRQKELSYIYRQYEDALIAEGWYDYDDMIMMVRDQIVSNAHFATLLREQYQYIMVDEFQDTNSLQASIVDGIMEGQEQPNILVVGDDEQSIYRFQGAVMENILNFCNLYRSQSLKIITLIENYRSTQTILDSSRGVIRENTQSLEKALELDKSLQAKADIIEEPIFLILAPDPAIEIATLIADIKTKHSMGIPWSQIAIIYRKNANPVHLIEVMRREGVPFHKQKGENLLHHPEAQKLMKTLMLIGNMHRNDLFWEVMLFDFWSIDLHHLLRLQNKAKAQDHHLRNSLFEAFLKDDDMFITAVVQKLISFEQLSANKTLVQFFEEFLEISGYRAYALSQPDRIERLSVLNSFFDEIKNIAYLHPEYSITDFITYMEDLDHYGLSPMTQPIRTQSDAVELMTAHGSKGLEFEAVYIFNATSGNWESSRDPSKLSVTISLFEKELLTKEEKKDLKLEEERRLWYVAMTRAKRYLTICATDNDDMRSKPSTFASEIPEGQTILLPLVDNIETISVMATAPVPLIDWLAATRAELEQRAKKYTLSVTGLNTWLTSPRQFMEKYLIRQPAGKMPSASLGTAVHAGLAFIGEYVNTHAVLPSSSLWHEVVQKTLFHEILTLREQGEFFHTTLKTIENYLAKNDCPLLEKARVEEKFWWKKVIIEGVLITGILDRVEYLSDNNAQVIDFKTGKAKKSPEQLADYERQLYFYKLLWDGIGESRTLVRGALDFVEDAPGGTVNRLYFEYTTEKLDVLKSHIKAFKESLDTLDFPEENTFIHLWNTE